MKTCLFLCLCLTLLMAASSCYRMPTEDDYSVVPATNHPDVTRAKAAPFAPSVSY